MHRADALVRSIFQVVVAVLCLFAGRALAQTQPADLRDQEIPRVFLVTIEPGDEPYERFGHDMIVIGDPNGAAAAYNFGVFDFDAPNFIGNFVLGKMRYWMDAYDWAEQKQYYMGLKRP